MGQRGVPGAHQRQPPLRGGALPQPQDTVRPRAGEPQVGNSVPNHFQQRSKMLGNLYRGTKIVDSARSVRRVAETQRTAIQQFLRFKTP